MNIIGYVRSQFLKSKINKIMLSILLIDLILTFSTDRPNILLLRDSITFLAIIGINYWWFTDFKFEHYAEKYLKENHDNENMKIKKDISFLKNEIGNMKFNDIYILSIFNEVEKLYKDNVSILESQKNQSKSITKDLVDSLNVNYKETINLFKDLVDLLNSYNYFNPKELNGETKELHLKNEETIKEYMSIINNVIENYKFSIVSIPSATSSFKSFDKNTKSISELRGRFKAATEVQQSIVGNNNINKKYSEGN